MRIGIDIRWMVGDYRGMGRFAHQLIAPVSDQIIALAPWGARVDHWRSISRGNGFFPWWEQRILPQICKSENLDYLICPYNTGPLGRLGNTRLISVIYDLIYLQSWAALPPSPSVYQTLGRVYRRRVVPGVARRADLVVSVSEFSKTQICDQLSVDPARVTVLPPSLDVQWFAPPRPLDQRKPFLLTVAGEQASKNLPRLLQAYALSRLGPENGVQLVVGGVKSSHHNRFTAQCRPLGIAAFVEFYPISLILTYANSTKKPVVLCLRPCSKGLASP